MIDLELVLYGLEQIADTTQRSDMQELMEGAIALLKKQEAVEPITEHHFFLCPVCKNTLSREQKFCHECGKRIEWEGW